MPATCFYPNGNQSGGGYPCNSTTTGHSACCGLGQFCASNGLCIAKDLTIFRGSCTDQTWKSDACPRICVDQQPGNLTAVQPCGGGKYSCTSGCATNEGIITLRETSQVVLVTNGTEQTDLAMVHCHAKVTSLTGVAIGVSVSLLVASAGAVFLYIRERRRNQKRRPVVADVMEVPDNEVSSGSDGYPLLRHFNISKPMAAELSQDNGYRELAGTTPASQFATKGS